MTGGTPHRRKRKNNHEQEDNVPSFCGIKIVHVIMLVVFGVMDWVVRFNVHVITQQKEHHEQLVAACSSTKTWNEPSSSSSSSRRKKSDSLLLLPSSNSNNNNKERGGKQPQGEVLSSSEVNKDTNYTFMTGLPESFVSFKQMRMQKKIIDFLKEPHYPPFTPGAFIHIGKTGGSTIASKVLRHGCHARVPKPCPGYEEKIGKNESYLSKTCTYIHVPDFDKLSKKHWVSWKFKFFVISIRDPYERTLSAFTYEHPDNGNCQPPFCLKKRKNRILYSCFPTLERFTLFLGDQPKNYTYNPEDENPSCRNLARALMDGESYMPSHIHNSFRTVLEKGSVQYIKPDDDKGYLTIMVIRNEEKWKDWISANIWLGQEPPIQTYGDVSYSNRKQTSFRVTKDVSDLGRKRLCLALEDEYKAYVNLLRRAVNLSPQDRNDALDYSRNYCPELPILQVKFITKPGYT